MKTGHRLVFLCLADRSSPPPYYIIKNQKMIVSYRGKSKICFHCNVEGHSRAQCPIQRYKTCYNCGLPPHSYSECHEDTLVTYLFNKNTNYDPYCYRKGYKGEENIEYGQVNCKEDVFDIMLLSTQNSTQKGHICVMKLRLMLQRGTNKRSANKPHKC